MTRSPQSGQFGHALEKVLKCNDGSLPGLLEVAEQLTQLENLLSGFLEGSLSNSFQVATVRKNRLILITPSAALATRLKMMSPQLLDLLRKHGIESIEHIDLRVAPLAKHRHAERKRRELTPAALNALAAMAAVLDKEDS